MLLQGSCEQAVSELLGVLKGYATGIKERRQGGRVHCQARIVAVLLVQPTGVIGRTQRRFPGLLRQAYHEEHVEALASVLQRRGDAALQPSVVEPPAQRMPHLLVMRIRRELDGVLGERPVRLPEIRFGSRGEQFQHHVAVQIQAAAFLEEPLGIVAAVLADVADHEHRGLDVALHVGDVLGRLLRTAECGLGAAGHPAHRSAAAAAHRAGQRAAANREHRCDREPVPVLERLGPLKVAMPDDGAHDPSVVYVQMVHGVRDVTEVVDVHARAVLPCQVRNAR